MTVLVNGNGVFIKYINYKKVPVSSAIDSKYLFIRDSNKVQFYNLATD